MSYLSFVMVGNNAGYGGNFLERLQACLDNLFKVAGQYKLYADITFVEWNPPAGRERIISAINWNGATIPVKIITVPEQIHNGLPNPHGEKFFEYIAKNVGIRRASGSFVLSTNPDNLYSEDLISRLAQHDFREDSFYRVNRSDTRDGKVFQVNYAEASVIDGHKQDNGALLDADGLVNYPEFGRIPILHFNASGDFILMSKGNWEKIKGHPEVPYSLTVDGQTVYLAAKQGLKQVILSEAMYHADHSRTPKYCPIWHDQKPFGTANNDDWGFKEIEVTTICL